MRNSQSISATVRNHLKIAGITDVTVKTEYAQYQFLTTISGADTDAVQRAVQPYTEAIGRRFKQIFVKDDKVIIREWAD